MNRTPRLLRRAFDLAVRRRLDFTYDHIRFPRTDLRASQRMNFLLAWWELRRRVAKPRSYPMALQLEPTTQCQLSCPLCPRTSAAPGQEQGYMPWPHYQRLMDEVGPSLLTMAFWQWGEPLLHPCITPMIRRAHDFGILTLLSTNGQVRAGEFDLAGLVASGLDMLIVSMDGTTRQRYETFRKGGSIERVMQFTKAVTETKRRLKSLTPLVNVRAIATSGNEQEIESVRAFARGAGADAFSIKSVSLYYDADPSNPSLPKELKHRSYQYQGEREASEYAAAPNLCIKPWTWPTLRHDGTLLLCECDHAMRYPLGNVFSAPSFRSVWQGPRSQELRRRFPASGRIDLDFCLRCRYKRDDAIREIDFFPRG